jgi:peptide-methionine (S)-S-oxide reductase
MAEWYNGGMEKLEKATFAGGCFWCTEAIFKRLKGVESVTPGYSGGSVDNPTYEQVSTGETGHAEAVHIEFDPKVISYEQLLDVFFHLHDPTTKNRQGNDVGSQYRSAIFYHGDEQRKVAEETINNLESSDTPKDPIVTEVVPFEKFYSAEDYHVNYFEIHKNAAYCRLVIDPKVTKLYKEYGTKVKEEYKTT